MILKLNPTELDRNYIAARSYQAIPISADFSKLIVKKPWGNEYLMYSNPQVEVWNLFVSYGKATSMHCHPNKKTALVVLDGKALFSSLNESMELSPMCAVILEPSVFHSTQAISAAGVKLLEFETPPMKHDLIRLEDKYGRVNKGYEGLKEMMPHNNLLRFTADDINNVKNLCNNNICIKFINNTNDLAAISHEKTDLVVIIKGSIISKYGDMVYGLVDVLHSEEFNGIDNVVYKDLQLLTIKRVG